VIKSICLNLRPKLQTTVACPDITTTISLLANHAKTPPQGHFDTLQHVLKSPKSSAKWASTEPNQHHWQTKQRTLRKSFKARLPGQLMVAAIAHEPLMDALILTGVYKMRLIPNRTKLAKPMTCDLFFASVMIMGNPVEWSTQHDNDSASHIIFQSKIKEMEFWDNTGVAWSSTCPGKFWFQHHQ